jgi:hypothetical protein
MKKQPKTIKIPSKVVKQLSEKACIKAVLIDGKWVTVFNKLENKTYH